MNIYPERHYCKGDDGRHLFVVDLIEIKNFPFLIFTCSIPIDFKKHPGIQSEIEKITWRGTSEEDRYDSVFLIFWLAKKIRDIEKYFFSPTELDSDGRYNYPSLGISSYAEYGNVKEFTPFSQNCNKHLFQILIEKFESYKLFVGALEVEKKCMEVLISNNIELQESYVDFFAEITQRHVFTVETQEDNYEFYVLSSDTKILLIFYKIYSR
jgi:hypothetical protein